MAIFRSTPERAFPSIERVMVSAGLAPPLPRVATLKVHAPGRWEPRAFRYHPYARAPLPTHYVDHQHNTDNVFAYSVLPRWSQETVTPTVHWDDVVEDVGADVDVERAEVAARLEEAIKPAPSAPGRPILRRRLSRMVIDLAHAVIQRIRRA